MTNVAQAFPMSAPPLHHLSFILVLLSESSTVRLTSLGETTQALSCCLFVKKKKKSTCPPAHGLHAGPGPHQLEVSDLTSSWSHGVFRHVGCGTWRSSLTAPGLLSCTYPKLALGGEGWGWQASVMLSWPCISWLWSWSPVSWIRTFPLWGWLGQLCVCVCAHMLTYTLLCLQVITGWWGRLLRSCKSASQDLSTKYS